MFQIMSYYLDNGMKVYLHRLPDIKILTAGIIVHHGSMNEDNKNNGISHFIEHLLLNKNTENKNMLVHFNELLKYGANYNAETSKDSTFFYLSGLSAGIDVYLSMLYEAIFVNKNFSDKLFNNEKKVIIQEYISYVSSFNQIKDRTNLSIFNGGISSDGIHTMIKNHPNVFPQFYTFDSDLRRIYPRFDFLINFVTSLYKHANMTVHYLIQKYGLEKIYLLLIKEIDTAFNDMNNTNVNEFFNYSHMPNIFIGLLESMIINVEDENSLYFKNVSRFEYMLITTSYREDEIYEFDIDILAAKKGKEIKKNSPCWVRFTNENGKLKIYKVKQILRV